MKPCETKLRSVHEPVVVPPALMPAGFVDTFGYGAVYVLTLPAAFRRKAKPLNGVVGSSHVPTTWPVVFTPVAAFNWEPWIEKSVNFPDASRMNAYWM